MSLVNKFRKLNDNSTIENILKEIGADFDAQKIEVGFRFPDKDWVNADRYCGVGNTVNKMLLSIMREGYGVIQYKEAVEFLGDLIKNSAIRVDYGAVTDNGARLHLLCTTFNKLMLDGSDSIVCYITVSSSHDGTGAILISCTPVHEASETVFTPMGAGTIKMRHTKHVKERLIETTKAMAKINTFFEEFKDTIRKLKGIKVTNDHTAVYLNMLVPGDSQRAVNTRDKITDIFKTGVVSKIPSCQGTLFGLLIAAQYYGDYYKTVRKSNIRNEIDAFIESKLTGDAAKFKAEALAIAIKLEQMA